MVTQRTLRRKLQKKKKRKEYRKCWQCGDRTECRVVNGEILAKDETGTTYQAYDHYRLIQQCWKCKAWRELQWTGKPCRVNRVVKEIVKRLKQFTEDLEKSDLSGYKITQLRIVNDEPTHEI